MELPKINPSTKDLRLKLAQFESEILDLMDVRDEMTHSDMQGVVQVLVMKIYSANTK